MYNSTQLSALPANTEMFQSSNFQSARILNLTVLMLVRYVTVIC